MRWYDIKQAHIAAAKIENTRTLSLLYRNRTAHHLGFDAPEMALITLIMSPAKGMKRDERGRWNHHDAERVKDGFVQGFSSTTVNKLIDARRCEAVKWNGNGAPVEVRLLPL